MPADPFAGIVAYLRADAAVAARVSTRVFAGDLPQAENASMPRACVVLKPSGGGLLGNSQDYGDIRVDVTCYGASLHETWLLHLDVRHAMKTLDREVQAGSLLHWARISGDGVTARDPESDWPMTVASYQVLAADAAIA